MCLSRLQVGKALEEKKGGVDAALKIIKVRLLSVCSLLFSSFFSSWMLL
jgi:hypothetical protein